MEFKAHFKLAGLTAALLLVEGSAHAQVLPGSVLPEQVTRQLSPQAPEAPHGVAPPSVKDQVEQKPPAMSEEAKKIKFELKGVVLTGNHALTTEQIEPLYQNKIGTELTVAQLFGIVQEITNFYRNQGYIISRAVLPPQHVKDGIVKIEVIEGYIDDGRCHDVQVERLGPQTRIVVLAVSRGRGERGDDGGAARYRFVVQELEIHCGRRVVPVAEEEFVYHASSIGDDRAGRKGIRYGHHRDHWTEQGLWRRTGPCRRLFFDRTR